MKPNQLNSGDTVIPLAGLVVIAAIISGSINSAIVTWKHSQIWWLTIAALLIGAIVSWIIAKKIGSFVFPAVSDDQVFVVKAGGTALPLTLKAAFTGSISASVISGLAFAYMLGGTALIANTWLIVTIVSFVVGGLWGTLSALL